MRHGRPAFGPVDGLPWDNREAHLPGGDPEAAAAVLEAADWQAADGDGIRERGDLAAAFTIVYPASDSTRQALALGAAQQLQAVGIDAEPSGRSWDEIPAGQLRKDVTSQGGMTAEALAVLMGDDGLRPLFRKAVAAAAQRSRELGRY